MPRPLALALALVATLTGTLPAQETAAVRDSADDALVLDQDFTGSPEFVRQFLLGKQVYQAELSSPDVTLEIRTPVSRLPPPRIYPIFDPGASGMSVVEIAPEVDGEYELRPIGMNREGVATRLRLYRDADASRRRTAVLGRPGWEVGIEVASGWNSGFAQSQDAAVVAAGGEPGSDVELCFSARRAPGVPRLSICAFGIGYQSQHGAPNVLWFFSEPRFRLLGRAAPGRSNWEMGTLFRAGLGMVSRVSRDPVILAPGLYVARHIRTAPDGRGWSLQASYARAWFKGFAKPRDGFDPQTGEVIPAHIATPASNRWLIGVGWYQ
jgi:hypothetical protein